MLAMHKNIQEKTFQEVKFFFEDSGKTMNFNDLSKLSYVEMLIKETMRLFPAGSMLGRTTCGKVQIGSKKLMKLFQNLRTFSILQQIT